MKKAIISFSIACLVTIPFVSSRADTLILYEGSVLVGKIISDDGTWVLLRNYYGTYRIKMSRINDIHRTRSSDEDIALHRKLKLPFNKEEIILNYNAGQGRITPHAEDGGTADSAETVPAEPEKEIAGPGKESPGEADRWTGGRISLSGSFLYNLGGNTAALPYGYGGHVAIDQGLDFLAGGPHSLIPGLRLEGGYIYFKKSSFSISGFFAGAGPMWAIPSMKNRRGCFIFALMPGASYLKTRSGGAFLGGTGTPWTINFAGQAIAGYQKSFGPVSIFLHARYLHVFGKGSNFFSVGGEAGIGFNAW